MIERYRKEFETDEILKQIIKFGDAEVSFSDEERKLKVRPDKLVRNGDRLEIIDYKSVADISKFKYDLYSYGYDISAGISDATLEIYKEKFLNLYEKSKNIDVDNAKGYPLQII